MPELELGADATLNRETIRQGKNVPERYWTAFFPLFLVLALSALLRVGLAAFEWRSDLRAWLQLPAVLGVGAVYDLGIGSYLVALFLLLAAVFPNGARATRWHAWFASVAMLLLCGVLSLVMLAEIVFWNEFGCRFNFIAIDYLVYTREVLGNIAESYSIPAVLAILLVGTLTLFLLGRRRFWRLADSSAGRLAPRGLALVMAIALPGLSFLLIDERPREAFGSAVTRELASNGSYEFFRAFRLGEIDYQAFYPVESDQLAQETVREEFEEAQTTARFIADPNPLTRLVEPIENEQRRHVILVSIESLGADYVGAFGGRVGLTPRLDQLAHEGLIFTKLYATGLRTVRGLEALTLSIPPTPGHAIPKRPHVNGLTSLGGVFGQHGYQALYIYGGYSYFDNMRDFFSRYGYQVIDRTAFSDDEIPHETIWGVADEGLFDHAVRVLDQRAAAGQRIFAHIMTTSNHRPFTYPEGRVDIPSGSGRDGAVKYTDWAIGHFIDTARTRPWFADSIFVFVADHTSHGRGKIELPPENYRIPLIIYAPGQIKPQVIDTLASQIDVGPTVLGLLNFHYTSQFFGQDILTEGQHHQRAFLANYLSIGYMEDGAIAELRPPRFARVLDAETGAELPPGDERREYLLKEAIGHYQLAATLVASAQLVARRH